MTPTQVFSCKIYKIFKNTFLTEHLQWLLLTVSGFQPVTLLKKRLRQRCFPVNIRKCLRTSFDRMPASCVYLWILRSFSEYLFYRAPMGNCLLHVQVAEFQPADTIKSYFTGACQAFYKRTRSNLSQAFIYLK